MRILLFGITQFAVKALKKLIVLKYSVAGVVVLPIQSQDTDTLRIICDEQAIPFYVFENVNAPEVISLIQEKIKPDMILTYTFAQKLSPELYKSAKYAINMHPSLLPNYRGFSPYFWPIANGEMYTGVSFHFLDDHFDTGAIIDQQKIIIMPLDTCGMVVAKQELVALDLLERILKEASLGKELTSKPQEKGLYQAAPKPTVGDHFIRWEWQNQKILNRIRALNPYSGAYTQYKNSVLAIYQAEASSYQSPDEPGTIVAFSPEGPLVRSANGAIILKILAIGKKYLLSGNDFISNENVKIGDKFIAWE